MRTGVIAYTFYESDSRVLRYAEALAERGDTVEVIALKRGGQASSEIINGVRVHRIQERTLDEQTKLDYAGKISLFFLKATLLITRMHLKSKFDFLHIHSVPDFLVFTAIIPKILGARVILDIHDILPEFFISKFNGKVGSLVFKGLLAIEQVSTRFADHVIVANHLWERKLVSRSVKTDKCSTMLNYPDESIFGFEPGERQQSKFIAMYPGTLNWHQGLDVAIRAVLIVKEVLPDFELHIYGEGHAKDKLQKMIDDLGLNGTVQLKDTVPLRSIARVMATASVGVVPKRKNSFGNEAFSTKILEFMSLGVPLVIADTDIDRYYFSDHNVKFFRSEDVQDLADAIIFIANNNGYRQAIVTNALQLVRKLRWGKKKYEYLKLVDRLVKGNNPQFVSLKNF